MPKPKHPLCYDPLCQEHNGSASELHSDAESVRCSALVLLLARWRDTAKLLRSIADPADADLRASSEQLKCCADQLEAVLRAGKAATREETVRAPAQCSGALTWSAEKPKRRGWWWVKHKQDKAPSEIREIKGRLCIEFFGTWIPVEKAPHGLLWAGPLPEPLEASDAQTLPNEKLSGETPRQ